MTEPQTVEANALQCRPTAIARILFKGVYYGPGSMLPLMPVNGGLRYFESIGAISLAMRQRDRGTRYVVAFGEAATFTRLPDGKIKRFFNGVPFEVPGLNGDAVKNQATVKELLGDGFVVIPDDVKYISATKTMNAKEVAKLKADLPDKPTALFIRDLGAGDLIMGTAAIRAIKEKYGFAHITFATEPHYFPLVMACPAVDLVIDRAEVDPEGHDFDVIINWCRSVEDYDIPRNRLHRSKSFGLQSGVDVKDLRPDFHLYPNHKAGAKALFESRCDQGAAGYIAIALESAGGLQRSWPYWNWATTIPLLEAALPGWQFVFLSDKEATFLPDRKSVVNLCGATGSFHEAAGVIDLCDLFVGPDSGLAHAAGAMGADALIYTGMIPAEVRFPQYKSVKTFSAEHGDVRLDDGVACMPCWNFQEPAQDSLSERVRKEYEKAGKPTHFRPGRAAAPDRLSCEHMGVAPCMNAITPRHMAEKITAAAHEARTRTIMDRLCGPSGKESLVKSLPCGNMRIQPGSRVIIKRMASRGDVLMASAMATDIKRRIVDVEVWFQTSPDCAAVLAGHPDIDHILTSDTKESGIVIDLDNSYERNSLALTRHAIDCYFETAGWRPLFWRPKWTTTCLEETEAQKLTTRHPANGQGAKKIGFGLRASWDESRCWGDDNWADLAEAINDADQRHVNEIYAIAMESPSIAWPANVMDMSGRLQMRQVGALIKELDLLITVDTGLLHIAQAVGTPCIALFGGDIEPEARLCMGADWTAMHERGMSAISIEAVAAETSRRLFETRRASIIIPVWGAFADFKACMESLEATIDLESDEVIVVDNGNRDKAAFEAWTDKPWVTVMHMDTNKMYAGANNAAARIARGEWLIFMNSDIETDCSDWVEKMIQSGEDNDSDIVGARLLYPDGTIQHSGMGKNEGNYMHRHSNLVGNSPHVTKTEEVGAVTGAVMAFKRDAFFLTGGFDEYYRLYSEDVDLCLRARLEHGIKVLYNGAIWFTHKESRSSKSLPSLKQIQGESLDRLRMKFAGHFANNGVI